MKNKSVLWPVVTILLSAAILYGAALGLNGIANANAQKEHLETMKTILPGSESFTPEAYDGADANIVSVHRGETGYVIETKTDGYAGDITMLVGVSKEGKVTGLQVRDLSETLGLGAEALTDWKFLVQFLNTDGDAEVGTNVDALTGATVTSKAIARSVNSAVGYVTGADTSSGATSWGG